MKKSLYPVLLLAIMVCSFLAGSWYSQWKSKNDPSQGRRILYYVDPMNPAHTSDNPGLAPCGMKMVPVYGDDAPTGQGSKNGLSAMPPGTVKISSEKQQVIGVKIGEVEEAPINHVIRTTGRVAADETRVYSINASVDGWIQDTYHNSVGSLVKKDERLASFYSPEFLGAQQAYIFALSSLDRFQASGKETPDQISLTKANIQQYKDSLRNLGMGELQIEEIGRTRLYTETIFITAPINGFVLTRNVSPGERFEKGKELYKIADLRHVRILADVFENEAEYLKPGVKVKFTLPHQKKSFQAEMSDVLPQFDSTTRTLKLRLEADNPGYVLKTEMFVDVEFPVKLPPTITVPVDAVLDSGLKKTVFVDRGNGFFEPRQVETGWCLGDRIEIIKGLMPGERIVISGTFLLDSESRMKLAATGKNGALMQDPVCGMDVDPSKAKAAGRKTEYRGKAYYFCSDECKEQFEKNPDFYLKETKEVPAPPSNVQAPSDSSMGKMHDQSHN